MKGSKQVRGTKYKSSVYQSLTLIGQFGIIMLVPIFMCSFVGIYLDRKFQTSFLVVLFFFIGALAGFSNVYRFARKIYHDESKDVHSEQKKHR